MQMLETEDNVMPTENEQQSDEVANCVAISFHALDGTASPKALQLQGWVGDTKVLMLIDSGSPSSFINQELIRTEI